MLIFRRTIVFVQHLVSSLSLGDCSDHSSTCFEHYYGHLQEDEIVLTQHLVSSLSLGDCSVRRLGEDCINTIFSS